MSASAVLAHAPPFAGRTYPDRVILNGVLHYQTDIQAFLERLREHCPPQARLLIAHYNAIWKPLMRLATWCGLRRDRPEETWLASADIENFLRLANFEVVVSQARVLLPLELPLISPVVNRWIAPLPGIRALALVRIVVARPCGAAPSPHVPSVSVVVPARNESGNLESLVRRLPALGPADELIFVEGHSTDDTWEQMQRVAASSPHLNVSCLRQSGRGKGDAVRLGFAHATRDILMILDADLTVPPEDLPKFYRALQNGTGDFINGSRLVYPMSSGAMQFANTIGNRFFAVAFSYLIGQRLNDTLCGTKVLWRQDYLRIASARHELGDFDPFGDFDLLFGAARLGLKITEVPVRYRERTYGSTNIHRWSQGLLLLRMTVFAARRLKFI